MTSPTPHRVIAHPFRVGPDGRVPTVEVGSDQWVRQGIGLVIGTVVGERQMAPTFGIPEPGWHGIDASDVQAGVDAFGPDGITITDVISTPINDTTADVQVFYTDGGDPNSSEE